MPAKRKVRAELAYFELNLLLLRLYLQAPPYYTLRKDYKIIMQMVTFSTSHEY